MNLPGTIYVATDSETKGVFVTTVCRPCRHQEYCTILAHAARYGSASEWREVAGIPSCIRFEDLPVIDRGGEN